MQADDICASTVEKHLSSPIDCNEAQRDLNSQIICSISITTSDIITLCIYLCIYLYSYLNYFIEISMTNPQSSLLINKEINKTKHPE